MELILASTSAYRRALLERLGVPFRTRAPAVDEDEWKTRGFAPQALAEALAVAKAESVAAGTAEAVVLGSDQLVEFEGRVLGKPETRERAVAQLALLSGGEHRLITAVAIHHEDRVERHTDVTVLRMRPLTRDEISRYVEADQPLDCAGAYKIECRGVTLFESIESSDWTAVTGLPLIAVTGMLRRRGFFIP